MRILVLGAGGYLGWPTALHLSRRGHDVGVADTMVRRHDDLPIGMGSLVPIRPMAERLRRWKQVSGLDIDSYEGDLTDAAFVSRCFEQFEPEVIVHVADAPQHNATGTLNLLDALAEHDRSVHFVKAGTMGEYTAPELDDSHDIQFACRTWGLRSTYLNLGIVYGQETDETTAHADLATRFDYDLAFGTVLNRLCVQAVIGHPLTVYGNGRQPRGILDIRDTLACIELVIRNPAAPGEYRAVTQFAESFSIAALAAVVAEAAPRPAVIEHLADPRVERDGHSSAAVPAKLLELEMKPYLLEPPTVKRLLGLAEAHKHRVRPDAIEPTGQWAAVASALATAPAGAG